MPVIPAPRFESSGCSPNGALGERNANCSHNLKVANPSTLSGTLPFLGGATQSVAGGMGLKSGTLFSRPPNGVQGQRPWHAFGDFRRETKVTRVPSMARPCSRGAPAYRGPQGPPPLQSPRGGPQSPLYLYPETNKKLHPNVQLREGKKQKEKAPLLFCRPCAILYLSI